LIETIDVAVPTDGLMLKWPNDLMLLGRKLAGVLLERGGDKVVIGFGVNLASAPKLEKRLAASLRGQVGPEAFAPLLAGSFARLLGLWRTTASTALVRAWQERAHLPGTRLSVHVGRDQAVNGRFGGLNPDGALRLILDDGSIEVIHAADVFIG